MSPPAPNQQPCEDSFLWHINLWAERFHFFQKVERGVKSNVDIICDFRIHELKFTALNPVTNSCVSYFTKEPFIADEPIGVYADVNVSLPFPLHLDKHSLQCRFTFTLDDFDVVRPVHSEGVSIKPFLEAKRFSGDLRPVVPDKSVS